MSVKKLEKVLERMAVGDDVILRTHIFGLCYARVVANEPVNR
jgi:hypothetical protein